MGVNKSKQQSWNDSFANFMGSQEGMPVKNQKKRDNKLKLKEEAQEQKADETKEVEEPENKDEIDEQRLYVMNLPFTITHDELQSLFEKYGTI